MAIDPERDHPGRTEEEDDAGYCKGSEPSPRTESPSYIIDKMGSDDGAAVGSEARVSRAEHST